MQFMILVKAAKESETGAKPSPALLEAMGRYNQALIEAGIFVSAGGLQPTSKGARVRFAGTERSVQEGPFHPVEAQVAGFWIFNVDWREEAIDWVKRCPNPMPSESEIEIRQLLTPEDFA